MIGRRTVIGLSLLSALLFCAFAAQGAFAAEKESENTTAFTCAPGSGAGFSDEHCDAAVGSGASFVHTAIANNTATKVEGSNDGVTESTKKFESAVLRGKIGLTATEITCEKFVTDATKSFVENNENVKVHKVKGTVRGEFKTCKVLKPLKCTLKEPVVTEATVVGVDGLQGPKEAEKNAMGLRFKGEIVSGTSTDTFANIRFEGAECALKNQEFPVTGSVIATSGPTTESGQENKHSGATLVFTPKFSMQKLHIGTTPNTAEFETIATTRMSEKGNPIALTTTT
jgi:hypothetical protein